MRVRRFVMMPLGAAMDESDSEVVEWRKVEKWNTEGDAEDPSRNIRKHSRMAEVVFLLDQIPLEVLEKIFSHLQSCDRKNVRFVCRTLYEACSRNENVRITTDDAREHFRHCRLGNIDVTLAGTRRIWDSEIWRDTGTRIRVLNLYDCSLGDRMVTSIIRFCDNLRTLRVTLKNDKIEQSFCSPEILEGLEIVRRRLETLKICRMRIRPASYLISVDHDQWKRIFAALLRIYPNLQHYTGGQRDSDNTDYFTCSFSTQPEQADRSEVSTSLAFLLSPDVEDWSRALRVFSASRFAAFSCVHSRFFNESLETDFIEFLRSQKTLVSVKVKQGQGRGLRVPDHRERESITSMIRGILRHCSCLRELEFDESKRAALSLEDMHWPHNLDPTERWDVFLKLSNIDRVTLGTTIQRSSASLSLPWRYESRCRRVHGDVDYFSMEFIRCHVNIEHLTLTTAVSDKMLRTVFKCMTRLKTLNFYLRRHNTSSALIDRREGHNGCCSIKCLQQLEELKIRNEGFLYHDSMFDEFNFPKLHSFHCFPPKDLSIIPGLLMRMPALRNVRFFAPNFIPSEVIRKINMELDTIHFSGLQQLLTYREVEEIFKSQPSLRTVRANRRTYYYTTSGQVRSRFKRSR